MADEQTGVLRVEPGLATIDASAWDACANPRLGDL